MKNLRELWGKEKQSQNITKEKRKLEPLPQPLRTGRIVSYENFSTGKTTGKIINTGKPNHVDQWFSLIFDLTNIELKQEITISWNWQNKPEILNYFKPPENQLINQLEIEDLSYEISSEGKLILFNKYSLKIY